MAKKNEALFEESSQGAVSAVTAAGFIFSMLLAFGGLVLMSYGLDPALDMAGFWIFAAGLATTIIGFALPFNIIGASGK